MLSLRISLFTRIVVWSFLNLIFVLTVLWLLSLNASLVAWLRLPNTPRLDANQRIKSVATLLVQELADKTAAKRDAILERYSRAYQVSFSVYDNDKHERLGGDPTPLPAPVFEHLRAPPPGLGRSGPPLTRNEAKYSIFA